MRAHTGVFQIILLGEARYTNGTLFLCVDPADPADRMLLDRGTLPKKTLNRLN